ncbi:hypothetical protein ED28_10100 [[Pantoea] beijingensis]|uniref:Uncharacterized protein n=2 Tax=[Pantoea] beijingensis TaxID=1324864 RepID=A0A443IDQ3_9GAMM|nr:hypothetical protein ED28_10100 [[Pantoea] beijingensis]
MTRTINIPVSDVKAVLIHSDEKQSKHFHLPLFSPCRLYIPQKTGALATRYGTPTRNGHSSAILSQLPGKEG